MKDEKNKKEEKEHCTEGDIVLISHFMKMFSISSAIWKIDIHSRVRDFYISPRINRCRNENITSKKC